MSSYLKKIIEPSNKNFESKQGTSVSFGDFLKGLFINILFVAFLFVGGISLSVYAYGDEGGVILFYFVLSCFLLFLFHRIREIKLGKASIFSGVNPSLIIITILLLGYFLVWLLAVVMTYTI